MLKHSESNFLDKGMMVTVLSLQNAFLTVEFNKWIMDVEDFPFLYIAS